MTEEEYQQLLKEHPKEKWRVDLRRALEDLRDAIMEAIEPPLTAVLDFLARLTR